jgi:uncharacterized protein YprB with RNaseH-like and TPR domain
MKTSPRGSKAPPLKEAKIAFFDIETSPIMGWTWGMYEQNVIDIKVPWHMLSFAWKWQGQKKIKTYALPDYPSYKKNPEDDSALVKDLWALFDQADILIAHNGDKFDIKKANARFLKHGLPPPTPFKSIDTLKIARNKFAFSSNRLNDLGAHFGLGRKMPHTGWDLWKKCLSGDPKAWQTMRRYNARDVELLEAVYLKLRAWGAHPNLNAYTDHGGCPVCNSMNAQRRGWNIAMVRKTPRFQCQDCGKWFSRAEKTVVEVERVIRG